MKIYSEKTGKEYTTVDECLKAEKAYDDKIAEAKAKAEVKNSERASRAKEITDTYAKYIKLRNEFIKDYGSFHMTYTDKNCPDMFQTFFDTFSNFMM